MKQFIVFICLAAILPVLIFPHAAPAPFATPTGAWSSGDRAEDGNRGSLGWKKIDQISNFHFVGPSKAWSPTIASNAGKTAVMWSPSKADRLVGFQWEKASGTWIKNTSFFSNLIPTGVLNSSPALVHREGDLLDVVVLGKDQYYHAFHTGGKWSAWEPIGGMGGPPSISASKTGPTKLDIWVVAQGSIWRQRWQQATGWQGWKEIGHPQGVSLTAAPGTVVRPDNTIDIVAPAQSDGQLWHAVFSPADTFQGWEKIPGRTFTQPSLISSSPDNLEVWVKGASDGIIYHGVWAAGQWQPFDKSVNQTPAGQMNFVSGPAASLASGGMMTLAGVNDKGEVLVRSWVASVSTQQSIAPSTTQIRRPLKSANNFVREASGENTIAIAPACNAVYLALGSGGDLQKQKMTCVINGSGEKVDNGFKTCDSTSSKNTPNLGSSDNQVVVLKSGTVLLLRQVGGINSVTSRTRTEGNCRGIETVYFASSCGVNWDGPVKLDPCDPNGPFDGGFCNNNEVTVPKAPPDKPCAHIVPPNFTGTDRPEILASRFDGSVFMAVGVAGAQKYNLVLMRSHESDLTKWKAMDTGLVSGSACSFAETQTHLYFARCEFGPNPYNAGLYVYRKDAPFEKKSVEFLGNLADASCAAGDVNISMMKNTAGVPIVRWVIPTKGSGRQFFKAGYSAITPGGLVKLQSSDFNFGAGTALPTLVAGEANRAFMYWYELGIDGKWRVRGSVSDGIGKWSPAFNLSGSASWPKIGSPWNGSFFPGNDYMKGSFVKFDNGTKYLAQWIQPDADGNNEIYYGIVDW